ncbi:hypothetical protein COO60DRAFT_1476636 [Scenedesmus sp. NREL 46B-D3]|nr:hypothetical protein COO60DRAFT_1476636 [Scenedesmus sp. NREL 46B-D3]
MASFALELFLLWGYQIVLVGAALSLTAHKTLSGGCLLSLFLVNMFGLAMGSGRHGSFHLRRCPGLLTDHWCDSRYK